MVNYLQELTYTYIKYDNDKKLLHDCYMDMYLLDIIDHALNKIPSLPKNRCLYDLKENELNK